MKAEKKILKTYKMSPEHDAMLRWYGIRFSDLVYWSLVNLEQDIAKGKDLKKYQKEMKHAGAR